MKKFENVITIILGTLIILSFLIFITGCSSDNNYIYEEFKITRLTNNGEIYGELTEGTGEGIYIDKTYYKNYNELKEELELGDIIIVSYNKDDYKNEVWDNIVNIKIK